MRPASAVVGGARLASVVAEERPVEAPLSPRVCSAVCEASWRVACRAPPLGPGPDKLKLAPHREKSHSIRPFA